MTAASVIKHTHQTRVFCHCVARTPRSAPVSQLAVLVSKQCKTPLEKHRVINRVKCFFFMLWTYIYGDFYVCTTYIMHRSQNWIWCVWCLLMCITSIMCQCPQNSVETTTGTCQCNAAYFADNTNTQMVCQACPLSYNAKELTDAHATSNVKDCIEIYQNI